MVYGIKQKDLLIKNSAQFNNLKREFIKLEIRSERPLVQLAKSAIREKTDE